MTRRATVDLQEAMKHLGYELWMLAETSRRIRVAQRDADAVATNAYLESMLFHARALSDFFVHKKSGFPSDIRRTDFGSVDWQPGPADAVARIRSNTPVIDKHLAHLTWERVSGAPHEWRYAEVQGSGHGVIFLVWSGPGFDLVAQDEIGAGVAGFGGGEVFTELGDGGGGTPGW